MFISLITASDKKVTINTEYIAFFEPSNIYEDQTFILMSVPFDVDELYTYSAKIKYEDFVKLIQNHNLISAVAE